eukprot:scaffold2782_cov182-Amphora_coffeaeformis.AAC.8
MYRRCQVDPALDILAEVDAMPTERAMECKQIIEEIEEEGRRTLELMPGAAEVFQWLSQHGIPTALVTRNTQATVDRLQQMLPHVNFDISIPRDYSEGSFPPKPHPASLQFIAQRWQVHDSTTVVMVGDSPSHDVGFGKAAGSTTALLDTGRRHSSTETAKSNHHEQPDFVAHQLWELPRLFWLHMEIPNALGSNSPLLKYDTPVPSTAACQAAAQGDVAALQSLPIDEIIAVCPQTRNTPLIWATDAGHSKVVEYILEIMGDDRSHLDARGYLGATAASRAACRGHSDCLRLLAERGANLDVCNDKMQYPLHFAETYGLSSGIASIWCKHTRSGSKGSYTFSRYEE